MSTISLRVPENELVLFRNYAKINNRSLSDVIRKTMLERIEDEFDLEVYKEAYDEWVKDGMKSRPIEELWKDLDI